jgi:hypothetical protein
MSDAFVGLLFITKNAWSILQKTSVFL